MIGAASLLLLFVTGFIGLRGYQLARFLREPHPPTPASEFYNATSQIGPHGEPVSGNSLEAEALAQKLVTAMTALRKEHFTESTKKSLIDQRDNFKIYCDLRPDQCVFLIHVPELRRFQGEAQTTLGNYAWGAAQEVLRSGAATNQPMKLAIALRGVIAYERVIVGNYSPGAGDTSPTPPEVRTGFGCEKQLIGWFVPLGTNASPAR